MKQLKDRMLDVAEIDIQIDEMVQSERVRKGSQSKQQPLQQQMSSASQKQEMSADRDIKSEG